MSMMKKIRAILNFILILVILWAAFFPSSYQNPFPVLKSDKNSTAPISTSNYPSTKIVEEGFYTSKEDVALYIHTYNRLPDNYVTKEMASASGWRGGGLEEYIPGASIGGNKFGNYEEILPASSTRVYRECDIDTLGMESRGSKRIVYSNDGLIYYTEDHYESFELLYGPEESSNSD
ncbi:MAG: ribonuclease [Clostridia bacterium]|nr:ribonuclease [Clostridia bacterium]